MVPFPIMIASQGAFIIYDGTFSREIEISYMIGGLLERLHNGLMQLTYRTLNETETPLEKTAFASDS